MINKTNAHNNETQRYITPTKDIYNNDEIRLSVCTENKFMGEKAQHQMKKASQFDKNKSKIQSIPIQKIIQLEKT